jgi:hypothetical protein
VVDKGLLPKLRNDFSRSTNTEMMIEEPRMDARAHFKTKHRFISDSHGTILSLWGFFGEFSGCPLNGN